MEFEVKKAKREKVYTKIALMAPSGGGKTYSSLRLATGMAKELEKATRKKAKILLGNTEQKRGYYYANEFDYDIVDINAPYNPEKFVEFIEFAVSQKYDILILDSTSHEWDDDEYEKPKKKKPAPDDDEEYEHPKKKRRPEPDEDDDDDSDYPF